MAALGGKMLFNISPTLDQQLAMAALMNGTTKSQYIRDALVMKLANDPHAVDLVAQMRARMDAQSYLAQDALAS
jgi:hypothetical protein